MLSIIPRHEIANAMHPPAKIECKALPHFYIILLGLYLFDFLSPPVSISFRLFSLVLRFSTFFLLPFILLSLLSTVPFISIFFVAI